jgi:hypothetical protein
VLDRARDFVLRNARLLDRHRFAFLYEDGPPEPVLAALRAYRNDDGGFGHALEPDLRGAASQPVLLEHALAILDEVDRFDDDLVRGACDWLDSVTTSDGGVPFVLPAVADAPHAEWWVATGEANVNPTAGIAGLLHKHGVTHPWIERATAFCWRSLGRETDAVGPDDAISVLRFLEHVPDRVAAEAAFEPLAERIRGELVTLDPSTEGYVKGPLDFAPAPERLARRLFDDADIARSLDALADSQEEDGGWPITWEPPSPAAVLEWRGFMTVAALGVLRSYGRLDGRRQTSR